MIAFIKNYKLEMIKKKFFLLYLLNVTDILFTVTLLQTGYFSEVNPFMATALQNPVISIMLKVILPAILLVYIFLRIKDADAIQLKTANIATNLSLTIYTLVNMSHIIWVALLLYYL